MAALLALAACGPHEMAPILTGLRCADPQHCQETTNPFLLRLEVDFDDPDGDFAMGTGAINLTIDGVNQDTRPAEDYFERSSLERQARTGTLRFDLEVEFKGVEDGLEFVVGVDGVDAQGHQSNNPTLTLEMRLE